MKKPKNATKVPANKTSKKPRAPAAKIRMVIEGEEILLTHDQVPVEKIKLDPANPRIRIIVRRHCGDRTPTPEELEAILWDVHGVSELYTKVRDNQGTIEPILINWDGTVIEGNCRTVAYRKLHEQKPEDPRWQTIPAHRFPKGVEQRKIDILLSMYHVMRKIPWRLYEQAGQVHRLTELHKMSPKEIEKAVGIKEKLVICLLQAYRAMNDVYLPSVGDSDSDDLEKFSYFLELYKSPDPDVVEFRKDPVEFSTWVAEGKFQRGEHVRDLPKILKDPEALKSLRTKDHTHKKAIAVVGKKDPTADSLFFRSLEKTAKAIRNVKAKDLDRLKRAPEQAILRDLHAAVLEIADLADIVLE